MFWTVTGLGFLGMVVDSWLGSAFQAKYRAAADDGLLDSPLAGRPPAAGYAWMTNDLVNFLAITAVTGGYWLWLEFFVWR